MYGRSLQKSCPRMCFQRFWAVKILNGYDLSGYMKRAQNSDSKTQVKSDFQNRNQAKIAILPFFRDTLYMQLFKDLKLLLNEAHWILPPGPGHPGLADHEGAEDVNQAQWVIPPDQT